MGLRPHDLLWIDPHAILRQPDVPDWVRTSLARKPCAVVRRAKSPNNLVPVGVRGWDRGQRFPSFIPFSAVTQVITPESLVMPNLDAFKPYAALPCFRALHQFSYAAAGHQLTWGPVGSVGFELATGLHVTTSTSDLDIMIRIAAQADFTYLSKLHRETSRMSTFVDVLLENAHGAVSLSEYLSSPHQLLIRTEDGPRLGIFLV